jgi:hypothetical protein
MDNLTVLLGRLAQSERYVEQGSESVERQRRLLAVLDRAGRDGTEARRLLAEFQEWHAMHVAERERLRKLVVDLSRP